jgi:uncharacterized protein (TIGR02646 family)
VNRIKKPTEAPEVLRRRGTPATRELCEQIDADPKAHKAFRFNDGIYAHRSVKDALRKAQHDKCALCESKITHIAYGDVEHFRPKAGYRQDPDEALVQPGYYWLAYEWSNLLFCCQLCNQQFKGNHFPLADPARRARTHRDDVSREEPLLINPSIEDPADFLEFRENVVRAIDDNPRGIATIKVFGLDRGELDGHRLRRFSWFRLLIPHVEKLIHTRDTIAELIEEDPTPKRRKDLAEAEAALEQFLGDSAEYAAMIRAALRARDRG